MKDPEIEHLFFPEIELRAAAPESKGPGTLVGYAVKWDTLSSPLKGGITEMFKAGSFTRSIKSGDALAVIDHAEGAASVFGRTSARTLALSEDAVGLRFENQLPDTSAGRDLAVQVARGDIRGVSLAFLPKKVSWENQRSDMPTRVVSEADIYHLSYEARPAYRDTTVALRSLEAARAETVETPAAPIPETLPAIADAPPAHVATNALARLQLLELD